MDLDFDMGLFRRAVYQVGKLEHTPTNFMIHIRVPSAK
jgi:hypothetical protein